MTDRIALALVGPNGIAVASAVTVLVAGAWGGPRVRSTRRVTSRSARRRGRPRASRWVRPTVATAGSIVSLATIGPMATAVVGALALGWTGSRPVVVARRRRRAAERSLPDAVERLVLLVHAGLTPHLAVRTAQRAVPAAVRHGFDAVVQLLDRGATLGDALEALPAELGPRAAPVADAFAAADRYGLPLEPMLDQLARHARAERRRLDEADARRLPVRLTFPLVTCTLPSFVLVAIAPPVLAAVSSLGGSAW